MEYISLKQAAKSSPYTAEYLGLRARQGKLKAVKVGRDWMTTAQWLKEYVNRISYRKNGETEIPVRVRQDKEQNQGIHQCPACGYRGPMIVE